MAGSLVPIVVGYAIAHYATLLIVEGQRVVVNLSDPLGRGWNVFGTADLAREHRDLQPPDRRRPGPARCHRRSATCSASSRPTRRPSAAGPPHRALAGQWPMLVVMVGYTCAGLVLLFSP